MDINRLARSITAGLRHDPLLTRNKEGYVELSIINNRYKLASLIKRFSQFKDIQELLRFIVNDDNKSRFGVLCADGKELICDLTEENIITHIRANQGHSCNVSINLDKIILDNIPNNFVMIHGTNCKAWANIKNEGLSKMNRDYIHFAMGLPGEVKSGMRYNSQVLIFIDSDNQNSYEAIMEYKKVFSNFRVYRNTNLSQIGQALV